MFWYIILYTITHSKQVSIEFIRILFYHSEADD